MSDDDKTIEMGEWYFSADGGTILTVVDEGEEFYIIKGAVQKDDLDAERSKGNLVTFPELAELLKVPMIEMFPIFRDLSREVAEMFGPLLDQVGDDDE